MSRRPRLVAALACTIGLAIAAIALATNGSAPDRGAASSTRSPSSGASSDATGLTSGTDAKFAFLSTHGTSSCGMNARTAFALARGSRLQGSCCSPMDRRAYQAQVQALRPYAGVRQIPSDPYDIPIPLVRELLRYEKNISLSPAQKRTFRQAMQMSRLHGPCCCRCWRWDAFTGLSKYLITKKGWHTRELAYLIGVIDGCGGPQPPPGPRPQPT